MTPDRYEDIEFEMNHELGRDEQREINRRVKHAQADPDDGGTMTDTDQPTTPEALAAHIAAELEDTMPERLDHVIVTTGRSGSVVRVRVQGIDLDAPDGVWVRRFDVMVREAIS